MSDPAPSLAGSLLIAGPTLLDPNFVRTVVLLLEHGPQGAVGVVLNRPTEEPVADHLPAWAGHVTDPPVVFVGGPVMNEVAVGVAERGPGEDEEWAPVVGEAGTVDLGGEPDLVDDLGRVRVFSGYAGWDEGQLDLELALGSWFVVPADLSDVFTGSPEGLWREVLARQPGRLALFASFPNDLRSN
jgi:putative transcriptional regulator